MGTESAETVRYIGVGGARSAKRWHPELTPSLFGAAIGASISNSTDA
jgi:hypothetical protein